MDYINSMKAKRDFVEQISKVISNNEAFIESLVIIKRMISISQRISQLEYSIIHVGAILEIFNGKKTPIQNSLYLEYGIYLSYIFVETSILLELEKDKNKSNSPNKVFNLTKQYIDKYYVNGAFKIAGGAISFPPEHFISALEMYNKVIDEEQIEIKKVKKIRNKYAAHSDIDFSIDGYNFDSIIKLYVALENAWINLVKSMGVIVNSDYMNFDEYKNTSEIMRNRIFQKAKMLLNQRVE